MALKDVIGQDTAVSILLRTIRRDRISSSYLFAGESVRLLSEPKWTAMNVSNIRLCDSKAVTTLKRRTTAMDV